MELSNKSVQAFKHNMFFFSNVNVFQASDPARLKNKLQFRLQVILGLLESGQIIPGLGTANLHPGQDLYQAS